MKKGLIENLKYHLVDSTALLAESTPVFAAFEKGLAGMSDEVSITARLLATGLTYFGGMGLVYAKGRDFSRKLFKITEKTSEKKQSIHDALYLTAFNGVVSPLFYLASGARNIDEIAIGTGASMVLGLFNGAPMGYSIDLFRDLTGLKNCERPSYPNFLKRQSNKAKKGLAALLIAGSLALTAGIYKVIDDKPKEPEIPKTNNIEKVIAYNSSTQ